MISVMGVNWRGGRSLGGCLPGQAQRNSCEQDGPLLFARDCAASSVATLLSGEAGGNG